MVAVVCGGGSDRNDSWTGCRRVAEDLRHLSADQLAERTLGVHDTEVGGIVVSNTPYQINPKLLSILKGVPVDSLPVRITPSQLYGQYSRWVFRQPRRTDRDGSFALTCQACGRRAFYHITPLALQSDYLTDPHSRRAVDWLQLMGYFRCKHCNAAGPWDLPEGELSFFLFAHLSQFLVDRDDRQDGLVRAGTSTLFDGYVPKLATDAEDHLLALIASGQGETAWIWGRLGNIYGQGGRRDLAAVAFEQAIRLDPAQFESLYSLGQLLINAHQPQLGAELWRRALASASRYRHLAFESIRSMAEVMIEGLNRLRESDPEMPVWPTPADWLAVGETPRLTHAAFREGVDVDWLLGVKRQFAGEKVGRNQPCPCGSGRKFKRCCGA